MKTVKLSLETAYEIKCEQLNDFNSSVFRDVYNNASVIIQEIIEKNRILEQKKMDQMQYDEQIYNMIAFLGGRGSGKSSVLASYCNFLKEFYKNSLFEHDLEGREKLDEEQEVLLKAGKERVSFVVLKTIDATMLENDEKILGVILSRMLDELEKRVDKRESGGDKEERAALIREIQSDIGNSYQYMHHKREKEEEEAPVMMVKALSNSWNLREKFKKMVEKFNRFFTYEYIGYERRGGRENYLVIPIDDIDMNVEKCWEMLEMLRKYLMVPKVILLLTFNFEQLDLVCRNHYCQQMFNKYGITPTELSQQKTIIDLTREYTEKVIPTGRKIYMPDLYYLESSAQKELLIGGFNVDGWKDEIWMRPKQYICAILRYYTGIIYYTGEKNEYFFPSSIRRLNNFVKEFLHLKCLSEDVFFDHLQNNIDWLYRDVVNRFMKQYVNRSDIEMIDQYINGGEEEQKRSLASLLNDRIPKGTEKWMEMLRQIISKKSWSYGDQIMALCLARRNGLLDDNAAVCGHLLLTMKATSQYFNICRIERAEGIDESGERYGFAVLAESKQEQYDGNDYLNGDWWGNWDKWYWLENTTSMNLVDMRTQKADSVIEIYKINSPIEEIGSEQLNEMFTIYSIVRAFVDTDSIEESIDRKEHYEPRNVFFGLDTGRTWHFSIGHLFSFIWQYEDGMKKIKEEIVSQHNEIKEERLDNTEFERSMAEWYAKYHRRAVIPFYSTSFMERLVQRFYIECENRIMSNMKVQIKQLLDIVEEELDKLDKPAEDKRWSELIGEKEVKKYSMLQSMKEIFSSCPVIKILRKEGAISQQVYDALQTVLTKMREYADSVETIDVTQDVS